LRSIIVKPPRARDAPFVLDEAGSASVTKRYAWTKFGMAFALMALDFIDRRVVVATFPYLKAEWGYRTRAGRAGLRRLGHRGRGHVPDRRCGLIAGAG
jgi:hypothetical protein